MAWDASYTPSNEFAAFWCNGRRMNSASDTPENLLKQVAGGPVLIPDKPAKAGCRRIENLL